MIEVVVRGREKEREAEVRGDMDTRMNENNLKIISLVSYSICCVLDICMLMHLLTLTFGTLYFMSLVMWS